MVCVDGSLHGAERPERAGRGTNALIRREAWPEDGDARWLRLWPSPVLGAVAGDRPIAPRVRRIATIVPCMAAADSTEPIVGVGDAGDARCARRAVRGVRPPVPPLRPRGRRRRTSCVEPGAAFQSMARFKLIRPSSAWLITSRTGEFRRSAAPAERSVRRGSLARHEGGEGIERHSRTWSSPPGKRWPSDGRPRSRQPR